MKRNQNLSVRDARWHTADGRWVDPPPQALPLGQIIISYVKLFLNNEKKTQIYPLTA